MKKIYFVSSLFLVSISLFTQTPQWQWANRGGSPDQPNGFSGANQYADNVVVDTSGNSYVTGVINSTDADFNNPDGPPWVTTYGMLDIFLAKYDCSGNLLWVNILGSAGDDNPAGLQIGHDGMIYLYGYDGDGFFSVNTSSGASTFSVSEACIFLAKFKPSGALEKMRMFDQSTTFTYPFNLPVPGCLQQRTDGDFIIGGGTNGGILIDSINIPAGFFLARVDTGLNVVWAKNIANATIVDAWPDFDRFVLDQNNSIFFAGSIYSSTSDTAIFGGQILTVTPGALETAVVMKFDSAGNFLWYKKGNSPGGDGANYPIVDPYGNIIIYVATRNGDTVLGFPYYHSGNASAPPCFVKLSGADGSFMYGILGYNNSTLDYQYGFDLKYGFDHNFYMADQLKGNLVFDTISVTTSASNGAPLIWEFKDDDTAFHATSNYVLLNGNSVVNDYNAPYWLTFDQQGSWYLAGVFSGYIYTPHDTIQIANGGEETDIFVAKYGLPCSDTNSLIPPLAPSNLVATATGQHAITVTWQNNAQYIQKFRLYRSLDNVNWNLYDSVPANITSYIDVNVQQDVIYWYKASAVNNAGESQFTNSDSAEIIPNGIEGIAQNDIQFVVQPNPNNGNFMLTIASNQPFTGGLIIYSADGREVSSQPVQIIAGNNWLPIQMGGLAPGIYIGQLSANGGNSGRVKFVVQ